jgi:hypothetical protein
MILADIMEWNEIEWNGMEWNGIEWNGIESNVIIIFKYYNYVRLFLVL